MKKYNIISEIEFNIYQMPVKIYHREGINVQDIGELLRGVPGVLTVVQQSHDSKSRTAIMKVKIITKKTASDSMSLFVKNSLERIPEITSIKVAKKAVEKKN